MSFWFPGHACSFDACSQPWDIKSGGSDGTLSTGNSTVRSQVTYLAPGDKPIAGTATQQHSANPRIIFPEPLVGMSVATSRDSSSDHRQQKQSGPCQRGDWVTLEG
ncbi:hypothetical protein CGCS363_v012465 [Colletotrichum siamense]|uniref:uncharacterized protein n=1 Tax=Colletotrichum siamense TaxID=690259 RepID=UPI001872F467|nr:uncharacterized protein CGCS363_v012465 [Colletotrichum siamense]KAF5489208.1 hypothetical protein CGCS363_v012465 [Colletotrichum siamense]